MTIFTSFLYVYQRVYQVAERDIFQVQVAELRAIASPPG